MRGLAALSAWLLAGPALAQMPLPPVAPVGTAATAPEWHDAFRHAVAACWNTGALSPEAQLRCAAEGYPLPPAARADWQRMELVFDAGVLR